MTKKTSYDIKQFFEDDIWPVEFISSKKFQHFLDKIPEGVFISNTDGEIIQVNHEAAVISGYKENVLKEMIIEELLPPNMREKHIKLREFYFNKPFSRVMGEGGLKLFIYNKDKKRVPMDAALFSIESDKGLLAVNIIRDVSAETEEKEKIIQKSLHDQLTGLPNRYYLYEQAKSMIAQAKRHELLLSVLILDLDKFKPVNDILGHEVGDLLLKELGMRLNTLRRKNEFVARLGGDEFVYIGYAEKSDDHKALPKRIIDTCEKPFILNKQNINISGSIGMILDGVLDEDIKALLMRADKNLYKAKHQGGGGVVVS